MGLWGGRGCIVVGQGAAHRVSGGKLVVRGSRCCCAPLHEERLDPDGLEPGDDVGDAVPCAPRRSEGRSGEEAGWGRAMRLRRRRRARRAVGLGRVGVREPLLIRVELGRVGPLRGLGRVVARRRAELVHGGDVAWGRRGGAHGGLGVAASREKHRRAVARSPAELRLVVPFRCDGYGEVDTRRLRELTSLSGDGGSVEILTEHERPVVSRIHVASPAKDARAWTGQEGGRRRVFWCQQLYSPTRATQSEMRRSEDDGSPRRTIHAKPIDELWPLRDENRGNDSRRSALARLRCDAATCKNNTKSSARTAGSCIRREKRAVRVRNRMGTITAHRLLRKTLASNAHPVVPHVYASVHLRDALRRGVEHKRDIVCLPRD